MVAAKDFVTNLTSQQLPRVSEPLGKEPASSESCILLVDSLKAAAGGSSCYKDSNPQLRKNEDWRGLVVLFMVGSPITSPSDQAAQALCEVRAKGSGRI
ncbi:unnamed protein product [Fusarium fujikuroi]|nr:unnamed protein product [Fusarium fujikuroi]